MNLDLMRRLIYDGNYEQALNLLLKVIEAQEERIRKLENKKN